MQAGIGGANEAGGLKPPGPMASRAGTRRADVLRAARILVVEDEVLVAQLLADRLEDLGCTVVGPVSRVAEALVMLADEVVDAAVLDVNIAGEKVFAVADALEARGVPFIFATAYGAAGIDARHAERAVLDKPYHDRALEHALRSALLQRSRH